MDTSANSALERLQTILDSIANQEAEIRRLVVNVEALKAERDALVLSTADLLPRTTTARMLGLSPSRVSQIISAARA